LSPERGFAVRGNATPQNRSRFRTGALILGAVLAVQAAWILLPEILRPALPFFPATSSEARSLATRYSEAAFAAAIGWPRGDLWTDKSLTANAAPFGAFVDGQPSGAPALPGARATAATATTLAPADARAWLLLAMTSARSHDSKAPAQLKMSYYTAPYSVRLFPLRMQIVAQLPQINDPELQGFLQSELKMIIQERPNLKPSIASAFRAATPAARQFFEMALAQLDAGFLGQLRSANP
jgi:hypothetical protein